jgi:hypothetical protein
MPSRLSWERIAAAIGAAVALALTAAAVALAFDVARLGCGSQAELERIRPPAEVTTAFAGSGFELAPARLPRALIGTAVPHRRAATYRHDSDRATLWVLVCHERCAGAPRGLDRRLQIEGRYLRQFSALGNNVAIFATDDDGRSGRVLQARVQHVLNDLDIADDYGSRCYVQ